jgi:hypothetical protein
MSDNHRSLASYFDGPSELSWHDQTEPLGAGGHHIPAFGMSDDEDEGLGGEMLGTWMWHPEHKVQVWVPDGVHSVYEKPDGTVYQRKGDTAWADNAWGADDHKARQDTAHMPKGARPKESKEARTARRDKMSKDLTSARDKAQTVAMDHTDILPAALAQILKAVNSQKMHLTKAKNDALAILVTEGKKGAEKNSKLHELTSRIFVSHTDGPTWQGHLTVLDNFCTEQKFDNIVGTDLPPRQPDGTVYLFVALSFLSQVKKLIMTGALASASKRIKTGDKSTYLYDFVNYSYLANDYRKRLHKDRYPKNLKKTLPDTPILAEWTKHIRTLERDSFKKLHPKWKIPKRLKDNTGKQQGKKAKGKNGRGGGGSFTVEVKNGGVVIHPGGHNHQQGKQRGKAHAHPHHTYNHQAREEPDGVPAPPARFEPEPVYYNRREEPWGQPDYIPQPVYATKRMQRRYY